MDFETTPERWLDRILQRATRPRQAAAIIATVTTSLTLISGVAMTLVDRQSFPSYGGGLWWAVQTVTTVGYGDHVPGNAAGKIVATLVMLGGLGFLTVITAAITSAFVHRAHEERQARQDRLPADSIQEIVERLDRIETALERKP